MDPKTDPAEIAISTPICMEIAKFLKRQSFDDVVGFLPQFLTQCQQAVLAHQSAQKACAELEKEKDEPVAE